MIEKEVYKTGELSLTVYISTNRQISGNNGIAVHFISNWKL